MNYQELKTIVEDELVEKLVGLNESQHFDAKCQPYILKDDRVKHEFAKDIVSFLNADGGFILLGGKTEINSFHSKEEVVEISWFPSKLISIQTYQDVLKEWVYPVPSDVEFKIISKDKQKDGEIICIINIPKPPQQYKPYLISKSVFEENRKTDFQLLGWSRRNYDGTLRAEKMEIHKWIQSGQLFEDRIMDKLGAVISMLDNCQNATSSSESEVSLELENQIIRKRISTSIRHLKAEKERTLSLVIYPKGKVSIPKIFESQRSPVANLMIEPPKLRDGGWDIVCGLNPKIVDASFLRNGESLRRVLDVYTDGMVIFSALININLLAWNSKSGTRIHPLALSESIWGVCAFFGELVKQIPNPPPFINFHLELNNMLLNGQPTELPPYGVDSWSYYDSQQDKQATKDSFIGVESILLNNYNADRVAYNVLKIIYFWFGLTEEDIPYTKGIGDSKSIDTKLISEIK